jgi:hypothetical protein
VTVRQTTPAAHNVVAGWLGRHLPPIPKHRSKSRAGYRKTDRKRGRDVASSAGGQR